MNNAVPKISYCVLTYNEEKNIKDCLTSIFNQNYPKDKLEVIVVDDNSTDRTLEIARKFPVKILINGKRDADLSATMGFHAASGDFYTAIGADMRFRGKNWFHKMLKPFMDNPDMAVALTRYYDHPKDPLMTRYVNLDPQQRDLVFQFFSTSFEEVIYDKKNGYYLMRYALDKIPPQTHGLYRVSVMRKIIRHQKIYYDMGNLILLVKGGYSKVGYVPDAGYYHFHAVSIKQLLAKRVRNVSRSYLRYMKKDSHYDWLDFTNPRDIFKVMLLVVSANLFFPIFLFSISRMVRYKNWLYLLDAPITFALVDTIIFAFLKDKRGWKLIKDSSIILLFRILGIKYAK